MIPKLLHSIWVGPNDIPPHIREWLALSDAMNSREGFSVFLHGNELLNRYGDDPYVKHLVAIGAKWAFVADRLRVLLLREEGGIYIDADANPQRPFKVLNHILEDPRVDFVTGVRSPYRKMVALHRGISLIDDTVMMSAKNGRMINRMADLWRPGKEKQTGYELGLEVISNVDYSVVLLNWRFFYSEQPEAETIALHDFCNLASWCEKPQFPAFANG